ncbi:MAG: PHP-associated domain-containing protein [Candidatus Levybacteria bacterium]|nr:PHP-associated domain-containing protein [Candidatus Levybacteria bacterium]
MIAKQEALIMPQGNIIQIPQDVLVEDNWGVLDSHIHLRDTLGDMSTMFQEIKNRGMVSAFTEHDNNENFELVWKLATEFGIEDQIMAGVEITVLAGNHPAHLLIYFPDKSCVPSEQNYELNFGRGTDSKKAIEAIHRMGGFCIWPHPTSPLTFSVGEGYLNNTLKDPDIRRADGLEVLNPTPAGKMALAKARAFYEKGGFGGAVGGSDGRKIEHLGHCQTRFPGRTKEDFIKALREGKTVAQGSFYSLDEIIDLAGKQATTVFHRGVEMLGRIYAGQ